VGFASSTSARARGSGATDLPGEELPVTVHGVARLEGVPSELPEGFCVDIYGDAWLDWASASLYARIEPRRMFTFHLDRSPE